MEPILTDPNKQRPQERKKGLRRTASETFDSRDRRKIGSVQRIDSIFGTVPRRPHPVIPKHPMEQYARVVRRNTRVPVSCAERLDASVFSHQRTNAPGRGHNIHGSMSDEPSNAGSAHAEMVTPAGEQPTIHRAASGCTERCHRSETTADLSVSNDTGSLPIALRYSDPLARYVPPQGYLSAIDPPTSGILWTFPCSLLRAHKKPASQSASGTSLPARGHTGGGRHPEEDNTLSPAERRPRKGGLPALPSDGKPRSKRRGRNALL